MIQKNLFKKTVILGIIILFLTLTFAPTMSSYSIKSNVYQNTKSESKNVDWWPMFRHDTYHTGYSTSDAPDTNNIKWNFTVEGKIEFSSPAIFDGRVYIASVQGSNSNFYCLDADTGDEIWKITDYRTWSSPAIAEGKVVIGNGLYSDKGRVSCYDAYSGQWVWTIKPDKGVKSSPIIVDGKVYIGSNIGRVYCIDLEEGYLHWRYLTNGEFESSPSVVNGKIYIGSKDKNVYCLDTDTGNAIWIKSIGYEIHLSSPTVIDEKVYIGSCDGAPNSGHVFCLDANTGEYIWDFTTFDCIDSSPAIFNGKLYIGSGDSRLYCLDASNGNKIWDFSAGEYIRSSPAVADGKVYFGSNIGVFCINADTGDEIWRYESSCVNSSPAIANGKLYIGIDEKIFCFYDDIGSDLHCRAYLEFFDIKPNSSLFTSFRVLNIGEPASLLDWEVESYPEWGEWTSSPPSGIDLTPEEGAFKVKVKVIVPEMEHTIFEGKIKVINSENPDDYDTVRITIATPRYKSFKNSNFNFLFERYFNSFSFLKKIFNIQF